MSSKAVPNSDAKSASKPAKLNLTKKKIDSPLAKYNSAGQLLCIVCNTVVKSELVWTAHINGRQHRENIVALKEKKDKPKQPEFVAPSAPAKRKHEDSTPQTTKPTVAKNNNVSTASGLPADFFESNTSAPSNTSTPSKPIKGILKNSSPASIPETSQSMVPKPATPAPAASSVSAQSNASTKAEAGPIPSGFFDDPVADAKARQVEYKDPSQEEWDKFTKEIAEAEQESRTLVEDDVEESSKERTLEEIDEQMAKLSRVIKLVKKKEELLSKRTAPAPREESSSSGDEEEVTDLFDWRSKKTFR